MRRSRSLFPEGPARNPWIVACAMTVVVLAASFWPTEQLPGWRIFSWDKLIHAGLFFGLTVAWLRTRLPAARVAVLIVLLVVVSEVGQSVLPIGREGDPFDALADLVGMALGFELWRLIGGPDPPRLIDD